MMKMTRIRLTPELAAKYLTSNHKNRTLRPELIDKYAKDMRDGLWIENGDTIRFDIKGRLLDGQHRLHAIIKSGVTIDAWICEGLPEKAFAFIDLGKKRTAGDALSFKEVVDPNAVASILANVDRYLTNRTMSSKEYSPDSIIDLNKKHNVHGSIPYGRKCKKLVQLSIGGACHYLFSCADPEAADAFMDKLGSGTGMSEGEPVYVLRERLMANGLAKAKLPRAILFAFIVKAWNSERAGQKLKILKFADGEQFPVIQ